MQMNDKWYRILYHRYLYHRLQHVEVLVTVKNHETQQSHPRIDTYYTKKATPVSAQNTCSENDTHPPKKATEDVQKRIDIHDWQVFTLSIKYTVNNIHSHQNINTTIARGIICVKGGETVRFQADKENGEDQHTQALKCCICHNIDCIID